MNTLRIIIIIIAILFFVFLYRNYNDLSYSKIIFLLIFLIIIFVILYFLNKIVNKPNSESWPPIIGNCPDYWVDLSVESNGSKCFNTHNLGKCNLHVKDDPNTKDFNVMPFNGSDGLCSKYKWTQECGVTWDGIDGSSC